MAELLELAREAHLLVDEAPDSNFILRRWTIRPTDPRWRTEVWVYWRRTNTRVGRTWTLRWCDVQGRTHRLTRAAARQWFQTLSRPPTR